MDVSLPGVNGFTVAQKLHDADSPVNVIFLTAYSDRAYVERAFQIGVKGYVLKGGMSNDLLQAIREVTSGGQYRSPQLDSVRKSPTH
jgi:DNA-binding NarL/FixJ family response regulator